MKALEGYTQDQIMEMSAEEIRVLFQKCTEEKQTEQMRKLLIESLDAENRNPNIVTFGG